MKIILFIFVYTNEIYREVNNKMRKIKGIIYKYIIGEKVIWKKYIKIKGKKFNIYFKFRIINIVNNNIILKNIVINMK